MTMTPETILLAIAERYHAAKEGAAETGKIAPSSWGAGYDQGYTDALGELYESITGDGPPAPVQSSPQENSDAS